MCSLKIYKSQLIRDKKLPEDDASGNHAATSGESSHGSDEQSSGHSSPAATTAAHGEQAESPAHSEPTATSNDQAAAPSSATHHAKRAILMMNNDYVDNQEFDYNPMEMARQLQEEQRIQSTKAQELRDNQFYLTLWFKSMASTMVISAMQLIASGGYYDDNSYNSVDSGHHLVRRSEPAAEGGSASSEFTDSMTVAENQFVYKTFLIFAGIILVINSLIKALNTKIAGMFKGLYKMTH